MISEAEATLARSAELGGFEVLTEHFEAGAGHMLRTGAPMDEDVPGRLASFDAILFGPMGDPRVPDVPVLWGTILSLRKLFDQYVNLRPARAMPGVPSPLRGVDGGGLDIVVVRENTEGEYSGIGGRLHSGDAELAVEVATFTRRGIERIVRYAFEYARDHGRPLTSATKSNALRHAMPFWDEVVEAVAADFPGVAYEHALVDALAARVITAPESLSVIVASNLHGDILSDITAAAAGSLGVGASANIDPSRAHPSLFQAVHGSAPTIAGQGIANPLAEIMSVSLMLEFLGEPGAAAAIDRAVEHSVADPATRTADLGGSAGTRAAGEAVRAALES